jgi:23S rRNA (guanosine2251-2'-O)-methyltransferase
VSDAEWVFGRRTVAEHLAQAPQTCRRLLLALGSRVPAEVAEAAGRAGVPVESAPRARLDGLARGGNHQGVCLEVGGWRYAELETLVSRARAPGRFPLLIALDSVQDPRNLGAVLRVADGVGAAGVVIPRDRAAGLSAAVARTASGALASVPVARVVNLARALDDLTAEGFDVVGAADRGAVDLYQVPSRFPCVLVLGGEHQGIRPNVLRRCTRTLAIPMAGEVSSLNLAVACGVLAYEYLRRYRAREEANPPR